MRRIETNTTESVKCTSSRMPEEILMDEIKELRTRVAELEKKVEEYEATKQTDRSFEALMNYQLKLNELQNRLSTVEKELKLQEAAWNTLADKNSTLLKASEGMEKALENCLGKEVFPQGVCEADKETEAYTKAKQALADFRAVKEPMKNGAGK